MGKEPVHLATLSRLFSLFVFCARASLVVSGASAICTSCDKVVDTCLQRPNETFGVSYEATGPPDGTFELTSVTNL